MISEKAYFDLKAARDRLAGENDRLATLLGFYVLALGEAVSALEGAQSALGHAAHVNKERGTGESYTGTRTLIVETIRRARNLQAGA